MHGNNQVWNEDRIEELTALWARGDSASVIGAAMMMSRNAILGKAFRLGLATRKSKIPLEAKVQRRVFVPRSLKPPREIKDHGEPKSSITNAFISFKKRPRVPALTKTELRAQLTLAVLNTGGVK